MSLAKHLLLENCWGDNLLSDISKVDYFEGNQGGTNLQPLDGLPLFVDDIYICGYLDQTEVVRTPGTLSCEPVSKQIVQRISKIMETTHTGHWARMRWKQIFPEKEVFACFVAKVDVSEVEIALLQERLSTLARLLESRGDSMYEIDYTQAFSGMVDRNVLVSHLLANGFAMQGVWNILGQGNYSRQHT